MKLLPFLAMFMAASANAQTAPPIPEVRLRTDAPPISPNAAKAMAPAALADLILSPGHAPVARAIIGRTGMFPPDPPGSPVSTPIALYLEPRDDRDHPGFCRETIAMVDLAPMNRDENGQVPPSPPTNLQVRSDYRLEDAGTSGSCAAPKRTFFDAKFDEGTQPFEAVLALVAAKRSATRHAKIRFPISVVDVEGPQMVEYERAHPDQTNQSHFKVITDPRDALAMLPVDAIGYAGPSSMASPDILTAADHAEAKARGSKAVTMFIGGDWVTGMIIDDGRISTLRMRREIPAPF